VLDVFAGSGSVGIEALSQGAAHCTFLDLNEKAVTTIKQNLERCHFPYQGPQACAEVRHTDAFTYLKNSSKSFDLLYVAPPQYKGLWSEALHCIAERPQLLTPTGEVIIQIDPEEYEQLPCAQLYEHEQRRYGKTLLVFMRQGRKEPL
jgi:16S rRNA (guanine966-N2)-methyltransferase